MINIVTWIIFGALAGWLASIVMKTNAEQGALANIVIGIIGAFLGGFIMRLISGSDMMSGFNLGSLLVAILGAIVLIAIMKAFHHRGSTPV